MRYLGIVTLIGLYIVCHQSVSAQNCADGLPFLGIGLGYNQYSVEQVLEIGNSDLCQQPMVYNWGAGPSPQTPGNFPHLDFPEKFTPMLYGCSNRTIEKLESELVARSYSGPLLVFNEPDRQDQANCPPARATEAFHKVVQFKNQYAADTGNHLQLVIGGVAEPTHGIPWMDAFLEEYESRHGLHPLKDGIADSVHFHLYPQYAYDNGEQAFQNIFGQLLTWGEWLTKYETTAWVTELGVLNAPSQPFPEEELKLFLSKSIPLLMAHPQIEHAFVFTLNAQSGTASENFTRSALIRDGRETEVYQFIKGICGDYASKYCTPAGLVKEPPSLVQSVLAWEATSSPLPSVFPAFTRPNSASYVRGYAQ